MTANTQLQPSKAGTAEGGLRLLVELCARRLEDERRELGAVSTSGLHGEIALEVDHQHHQHHRHHYLDAEEDDGVGVTTAWGGQRGLPGGPSRKRSATPQPHDAHHPRTQHSTQAHAAQGPAALLRATPAPHHAGQADCSLQQQQSAAAAAAPHHLSHLSFHQKAPSKPLIPGGPCENPYCGVVEAPQWRRIEKKLVCNRCGMYYHRHAHFPDWTYFNGLAAKVNMRTGVTVTTHPGASPVPGLPTIQPHPQPQPLSAQPPFAHQQQHHPTTAGGASATHSAGGGGGAGDEGSGGAADGNKASSSSLPRSSAAAAVVNSAAQRHKTPPLVPAAPADAGGGGAAELLHHSHHSHHYRNLHQQHQHQQLESHSHHSETTVATTSGISSGAMASEGGTGFPGAGSTHTHAHAEQLHSTGSPRSAQARAAVLGGNGALRQEPFGGPHHYQVVPAGSAPPSSRLAAGSRLAPGDRGDSGEWPAPSGKRQRVAEPASSVGAPQAPGGAPRGGMTGAGLNARGPVTQQQASAHPQQQSKALYVDVPMGAARVPALTSPLQPGSSGRGMGKPSTSLLDTMALLQQSRGPAARAGPAHQPPPLLEHQQQQGRRAPGSAHGNAMQHQQQFGGYGQAAGPARGQTGGAILQDLQKRAMMANAQQQHQHQHQHSLQQQQQQQMQQQVLQQQQLHMQQQMQLQEQQLQQLLQQQLRQQQQVYASGMDVGVGSGGSGGMQRHGGHSSMLTHLLAQGQPGGVPLAAQGQGQGGGLMQRPQYLMAQGPAATTRAMHHGSNDGGAVSAAEVAMFLQMQIAAAQCGGGGSGGGMQQMVQFTTHGGGSGNGTPTTVMLPVLDLGKPSAAMAF